YLCYLFVSFVVVRTSPPGSSLFPYTTLFRSRAMRTVGGLGVSLRGSSPAPRSVAVIRYGAWSKRPHKFVSLTIVAFRKLLPRPFRLRGWSARDRVSKPEAEFIPEREGRQDGGAHLRARYFGSALRSARHLPLRRARGGSAGGGRQ